MLNKKNKQNHDQNINMECDSIPSTENVVESMDVEVLPINPAESEATKQANKSNSEFGIETEEVDFENYSDDDESRPCGIIEYKFENFSRSEASREHRYLSDAVKIRCLPWKILLLFNKDDLGIFVQCNGDCTSTTWNCSAKARIELVSQTKAGAGKTNHIGHVFTHKENDWGYRSFIKFEEILNPQNGYIFNDSILVRASVEAEAPHGVDWDSKKHTGFVGLKNQGATCYLNSLLQTLYFTNKLRKAVFLMPTESDDSQTSVPLALQRVFYELQFTKTAVGTKKLTRSFGWATLDSFMQHDAQELCRVLLDNLENKMKGTSVEDVIPGLFCGKMLSYIRCKNVSYESKREENFYDIQLKVKGNQTVYDAFREYIDVETLDDENKYDAGEYGMQAAEKGVVFTKFPPVLYLQLMRFQYDYQTDMNIKINDRFEFPYKLNLDEFLQEKDPNNPAIYFLHAVLVHSGDNHGGHYVVFLNPRGDHSWYEFDDDVVSRCERKAAIHQNYGTQEQNVRASSSAYMLVYIAESAKDDVLCSVEERDIPDYLLDRFREDNRIEELKYLEKRNAHLFTLIHLILEEDFYGYEGPGLFIPQNISPRTIRVHREFIADQFINEIAQALNRPSNSIRVWKIVFKKEYCKLAPFDLSHITNRLGDDPIQSTFYVQFLYNPSPRSLLSSQSLTNENEKNKFLIFFKFFNRISYDLRYVGMIYESAERTFSQLTPNLSEMIGSLSIESRYFLFKYEINDTLTPINLTLPIGRSGLSNGEVIIFTTTAHDPEMDLSIEETAHDVLQCLDGKTESFEDAKYNGKIAATVNLSQTNNQDTLIFNDAFRLRRNLLASHNEHKITQENLIEPTKDLIKFYIDNFPFFMEILLVDKNRPCDPGILLKVRHNISYWEFAESVAKVLDADPHYLQFFRSLAGSVASQIIQATSPAPQVVEDSNQNCKRNTPGCNTASGQPGTGNESTDTPSPGTGVTSLISNQSLAAKASGFTTSSPTTTTLLANAALQGLSREQPGPAITSTSQTMNKFLIPIDAQNSINISNMSQHQYSQSHQSINLGSNINTQALINGDRMPYPIIKYSGSLLSQTNSLGSYNIFPPRRVYYVHLAISIEEQETMRQIKCIFVGPKLTDSMDITISVPETGTVKDLLNEAQYTIPSSMSIHIRDGNVPSCLGTLRLLEIQGCQVIREVDPELSVKNLQTILTTSLSSQGYLSYQSANQMTNSIAYRIEEIPPDEETCGPDEKVIWVSHIEPESGKNFGVPFSLRIKNEELLSSVKERIRKRLDVSEKEFERWKLIYHNGNFTYLPAEENFKVDITLFQLRDTMQMQPYLMIEHKPAKRARYAPSQKPIKIHN